MSNEKSAEVAHVFGIGRYQLENLLREGIGFFFLDLRSVEERSATHDPLLEKAVATTDVREALKAAPADAAIVLLSQDGKAAADAARGLSDYKNVYIVRDGALGIVANPAR